MKKLFIIANDRVRAGELCSVLRVEKDRSVALAGTEDWVPHLHSWRHLRTIFSKDRGSERDLMHLTETFALTRLPHSFDRGLEASITVADIVSKNHYWSSNLSLLPQRGAPNAGRAR